MYNSVLAYLGLGERLPHFAELDNAANVSLCIYRSKRKVPKPTPLCTQTHTTGHHLLSDDMLAHSHSLQLDKRALIIWPSQRLESDSRYIVALRKLRNKQGDLVAPSMAFTSLRYETQ